MTEETNANKPNEFKIKQINNIMTNKSFSVKQTHKKNLISISPLNTIENLDYPLTTFQNLTKNDMKSQCIIV